MGLKLLGRGTGSDLRVDPLALVLHGGTTIGTSVTHSFTLSNDNGAEREWRWLDAAKPAEEEAMEALGVVLEPAYGVLPAEESATVSLTLTPRALGLLKRKLTFGVAPHGREVTLSISPDLP